MEDCQILDLKRIRKECSVYKLQSNFTTELKKELLKNREKTLYCKMAQIAGFLQTTAQIIEEKGQIGFKIITESEMLAEYFLELIEDCFGLQLEIAEAKIDKRNGRERLILQALSQKSIDVLYTLGLITYKENLRQANLQFPTNLLVDDCCKKAYILGAFLGSGSCSLPTSKNNGYHLEFVFYNREVADCFVNLLSTCDILSRQIERKNSIVVYIKSRESICDFLAFLEVTASLKKFDEIAQIRDTNNQINRWTNCKLGNMDRTITASIQQVQAIERIDKTIGLNKLDAVLLEVATARLQDKNCSMQELADRLKITKSCLNHRMRKLLQIAKEYAN